MKIFAFVTLLAVAFAATKDELNTDAAKLKQLAQAEIKKLEAEGKHLLAQEIQVIEKEIIAVEKHLESLHPATEVGKVGIHALESVLKGLEQKLAAELRKLNGNSKFVSGTFYDKTKDELVADAAKLKKLAVDEIKKLNDEGKSELANGIKTLEKDIETVEKHIESLQPNTELGKLSLHAVETVLKGLEEKLEAELKKLSGK